MPHPNTELLKKIKARKSTATEFKYGIRTAEEYVKNLQVCVGDEFCWKNLTARGVSFQDVLSKSARTLTYNNPEMTVEEKSHTESVGGDYELPKNTLMVFKNTLTTSRMDRDGDILRTAGAEPDPEMLLLWQHVHTLPIGKMLAIVDHTESKLSVVTAIVDINDLAHDSAVMVDNKMGRFSHGFRALQFSELKAEPGETSSGGFDIKRFEILEESLVSVPSNADAETEEVILDLVEGKQLTSGVMKAVGANIREKQTTTTVAGGLPDELKEKKGDESDQTKRSCSCGGAKTGSSEGGSSSSTETKKDETREAADTKDSKGLTEKWYPVYAGMLDDSWEKTIEELGAQAHRFLKDKGLVPEKTPDNYVYSYAYVLGTWAGEAVICCYIDQSSDDDVEYRYYQASWSQNQNEVAEFFGDPVQVEVSTTVEIERKTEKAVQLDKKSVDEDLNADADTDTGNEVQKAMSVLMVSADEAEQRRLVNVLSKLLEQKKNHREFQSIKGLVGSK